MTNEENTNTESGNNNSMASGLIMIAVGVIFLVMQNSNFRLNNWWALFILIPVVTSWSRAAKIFKEAGELTEEATQVIAGSLFPLFVAAIFLFNWDWGKVWPGFIIIAGFNALARVWGKQPE